MDESLGPLFVPPWHHEGLGWMQLLPLLCAGVAAAIALVGLWRGRLALPIGLAGLLAFPLAGYFFGGLLMLEDSKRLTFCGSCHVMEPLKASVTKDDGSLASKHFAIGAVPTQEACYVCHSGYGIWGTVGAKMSGVGHMIRTVTGNYQFPIKLVGTFDINSCLGCHAASLRFRAVEEHRPLDVQRALLSGEMTCTGLCHPEAHPAEALNGGEAAR